METKTRNYLAAIIIAGIVMSVLIGQANSKIASLEETKIILPPGCFIQAIQGDISASNQDKSVVGTPLFLLCKAQDGIITKFPDTASTTKK